MGLLNGLIETYDHEYGELEIQSTELNPSFEGQMNQLKNEIEKLGQEELELNRLIDKI
ncbi:hypothetical protein Ct9H90mP29_06590 [bacterium]|nr:MAG: hypothetical protein Ct9H90mP29_06590 [bacterium]